MCARTTASRVRRRPGHAGIRRTPAISAVGARRRRAPEDLGVGWASSGSLKRTGCCGPFAGIAQGVPGRTRRPLDEACGEVVQAVHEAAHVAAPTERRCRHLCGESVGSERAGRGRVRRHTQRGSATVTPMPRRSSAAAASTAAAASGPTTTTRTSDRLAACRMSTPSTWSTAGTGHRRSLREPDHRRSVRHADGLAQ